MSQFSGKLKNKKKGGGEEELSKAKQKQPEAKK